MKQLKLTNGTYAQVDDEDYERLIQYTWLYDEGRINRVTHSKEDKELYSEGRKTIHIPLANEVMNKFGVIFDHKDQDFRNNQKDNLRECTRSQNNSNTIYYNSHGFRGVSKNKRRWRAVITFNKKRINIGSFKTKEEAARAYDIKARELYGEFAILNFNS